MTSNVGGELRDDLNAEFPSSGDQAFMAGRWQHPQRSLVDRGSQRRSLDDLLALVRRGFSGVLVLRGSHGVGKTTLLDYAVEAASGFRISAIAGVGSEINLHYAGLF